MKPAIFVAIGTSLVLAQEVLPFSGSWGWLERGGAIGILGFAVVWYMTRTIPAMQRDHRSLIAAHKEERLATVAVHKEEREVLALALKEERNRFLERMDRWAEGARQDSKALNDTLHTMTEHCKEAAVKFGSQGGMQ